MTKTALNTFLIGLLVWTACGDDGNATADANGTIDATIQADASECVASAGIVYLNQQAGAYTSAAMDNATTNETIVLDVDRTLAPYDNAAWPQIVQCMTDGLSAFNIQLVETDPGDIDHTEMVFTEDSYWGGMGVSSISASNCGQTITRPLAFVFAGSYGPNPNVQVLCEGALQQWAVATLGLDHAFRCEDYLTYLSGCGNKMWVDEEVPCGEFEARDCACSGAATQNSYQTILANFGPSCQ